MSKYAGSEVKIDGEEYVIMREDDVLAVLEVYNVLEEGIHLRTFSSRNIVERCWVHDTGKGPNPHYGEGIYLGSANNNWCTYTDCGPDNSDFNVVRANRIGPNTTAEAIDVKEGTTGGQILDNVMDGSGMVNPDGADSWIDVKGNGYLLEGNRGENSPRDGFQVHQAVAGWGMDNVFRRNAAVVNAEGYGINVHTGQGNLVACDNVAQNAGAGLSNVTCRQ